LTFSFSFWQHFRFPFDILYVNAVRLMTTLNK